MTGHNLGCNLIPLLALLALTEQDGAWRPSQILHMNMGRKGGNGDTVTPAGSRATRLGEHDGSGGRVKLEGSNSEREQQAGAAQIQAAMRIARGLLCEGKGSVIIDDRA